MESKSMEKTIIEGGEQPVKTEEKDKEIAMLKDALKSRDILQEEDGQEIERLKKLLLEVLNTAYRQANCKSCLAELNQFKTDNFI